MTSDRKKEVVLPASIRHPVASAMTPVANDIGYRDYTDAELYRILVAELIDGVNYPSKAAVDEMVRGLSTLTQADEVLSHRGLRPGCNAWRRGGMMVCECGVVWKLEDADPPACRAPRDL